MKKSLLNWLAGFVTGLVYYWLLKAFGAEVFAAVIAGQVMVELWGINSK